MDLTAALCRYEHDLLHDTLPFWLLNGLDKVNGGVHTSLDRVGHLIDSDKAIWPQGRFAWLLATLYNTVEARGDWLEAALSCLGFLEQHGFDRDGRMYFLVTTEGKPLRKRRYAYSEAFASIAYGACSKAAGHQAYATRAKELFAQFRRVAIDPGEGTPKVHQNTRPSKGIGPLMIGLNVAQTLRETIGLEDAEHWIDQWIGEIERDFCKPELGAVMESVAPDGSILDHFDGRLLNPGHAIEAAWFILKESQWRGGDTKLTQLGVQILDWMWERGWDPIHGGLYSFRDVHEQPLQTIEHDMKFWWPHNEACIATLFAGVLTGDRRHFERHQLVHDWSHQHFADPTGGEWFGYLHRDGSPSTTLKGNHWKGPFHVPRMQWQCRDLLKRHLDL